MHRLPKTGEYHHLLYCRNSWESMPHTRKLRQKPELILPMDKDVEEELHRSIVTVPLLDHYTASHANRLFVPTSRYMSSVHNLISAIDEGASHPRTQPLERQLAELTIHAIELQIPFIQEGLLRQEVSLRRVA